MRCARIGCYNPPKQDRLTCSDDCAQLVRAEAKRTPYGQTDSSSTRDDTEPSDPSSGDDSSRTSDGETNTPTAPSSGPRSVPQDESPTGATAHGSESGPSGTETVSPRSESRPGIQPEAFAPSSIQQDGKRSLSGNEEETRLMGFIAPLPGTDGDRSPPRNLLDSTLIHLHDLMKQVGKETTRHQTAPDTINAVCNVAKQMRDLMVLKLDVVKTARKIEEAR